MASTIQVPETQSCNFDCFIISAFPASGKSWLTTHFEDTKLSGFKVVDLDSTLVSKLDRQQLHGFKKAYLAEVKEAIGPRTVIFVSTHEEIRSALVEEKLKFALVYPSRNLKEHWLGRLRCRGSSKYLFDFVWREWSTMLNECENQGGCEQFILHEGEYLSGKIDIIIEHMTAGKAQSPLRG